MQSEAFELLGEGEEGGEEDSVRDESMKNFGKWSFNARMATVGWWRMDLVAWSLVLRSPGMSTARSLKQVVRHEYGLRTEKQW